MGDVWNMPGVMCCDVLGWGVMGVATLQGRMMGQ
jgi:hypothetical protein